MNGLILGVLFGVLYHVHTAPLHTEEDEYNFKSWMSEHNKQYDTSEFYQRLQIFLENKKRIDIYNAGNHSSSLGLNQFADMTSAEFNNRVLMRVPQAADRSSVMDEEGLYEASLRIEPKVPN